MSSQLEATAQAMDLAMAARLLLLELAPVWGFVWVVELASSQRLGR